MRPGARWEYARFRYSPSQDDWSWRSGTQKLAGSAMKVYQSFWTPRPTDGEIWYGEVLSLAGQQGWEVIEMQDFEAGSEVWFKRSAQ